MVNVDLGSMPNKYKNFNSLEDFIKTIDYLEEKLQSNRSHKGDLKQKIERLKSFAITYMQNLQKGSQKTTPEDLAQNGSVFLEKFGPDKNGNNYSDTAIKFKDWMAKQPVSSASERIQQKDTPKKEGWFRKTINYFKNRNNFDIKVLSGAMAIGTVVGGACIATATGGLGIPAFVAGMGQAAIWTGATIVGGAVVVGAAKGISTGIEKLGGLLKSGFKSLRKKVSNVYKAQKEKSHSGLKMALQLGAISTVMIGTSVATLNPALGLGVAALYGAGATAALGVVGATIVKGVKKLEDWRDNRMEKQIQKELADMNKKAAQKQHQHEEVKRRKEEMLKNNQERKAQQEGNAQIVEMYPDGNPYQQTDANAPMREVPNLVQLAINNGRQNN